MIFPKNKIRLRYRVNYIIKRMKALQIKYLSIKTAYFVLCRKKSLKTSTEPKCSSKCF